ARFWSATASPSNTTSRCSSSSSTGPPPASQAYGIGVSPVGTSKPEQRSSSMLDKVLIANRGEIALRILRACRQLDIPVIAAYSSADRDLNHVLLAEEAVCIGPPTATASYLNMAALMSAAEVAGATAVHPG